MGASTETIKQREHWGGRAAFILAAIGSAVGLGNLWGFPYKLYESGGGAFLIPYFIALVCLGLPLLIMEFSVGHWAQNSPPGAFRRIFRRYGFVGWWLTALAFVIITYYAVVLGWCVVYLWDSILGLGGTVLPWAENPGQRFESDLLKADGSYALGPPRWPVLIGTAITWLAVYFCLFRGVKWVSKVVLFTVPLPWLMLVVLTVRGLTLEGAETGLHFYLEPDWSKLALADTWRLAFGQVFFSLSLGFAVMLSYASFLHRKSDLNNNAAIIGLGDLATSFVAGLAVFSTLGALALQNGEAVGGVVADGAGLAFVAFPHALSQLGDGAAIFATIFFLALLTLGIDSAFSIVEAVQASVNDNKSKRWRARWTLPLVCLIGFLCSVLFTCARGGVSWLSLIDDMINGPLGILSVALAEALVVGWAWKGDFLRRMREHANERSDWRLGPWWDIVIRYLAPGLLLAMIAWSMSDWVRNERWGYVIATAVFALVPLVFLLITGRRDDATAQEAADEVSPERRGGAVWPIIALPMAAALLGVLIGLLRMDATRQAAAEQALADRQAAIAVWVVAIEDASLQAAGFDDLRAAVTRADAEVADAEAVEDLVAAEEVDELVTAWKKDDAEEAAIWATALSAADKRLHPFEPKQLGTTAYVILAVAFLVIFGGLAWCFWMAMRAAGGRDEPYLEKPTDPGT